MSTASPSPSIGPARALAALRRFSGLMAGAQTPQALSRGLCRVLVEDCGYLLAWVGTARHDEGRTIEPCAFFGVEDGYLESLRLTWSGRSERGRGPSGTCVREGRTCVAADLGGDPRFAPWREDALKRGFRASVAVPLGAGAPAAGTLAVYAADKDAFGTEEVELLEELATALQRGLRALELQERLRASEAKFRALVERSLAGVYVIQDRRFAYASPRMARILGYSVEELLALPDVMTTVMPEDQVLVAENIKRRLEGDAEEMHYRLCGRRKDGRLVRLEVLGSRVEYEGRPAVMGTLLDVTEQHELQERLAESRNLEAMGRLAGGVAHDFNNLLTSIMGSCDLALERTSPVDPRRLELEDIRRASDRAAALTRQLLSFSRKQAVAPRVLEPAAVVRSLEAMLRRLLREDIRFELDARCRARVRIDPGQLEQVVASLVVNARDAMPDGGALTLKVTEEVSGRPLSTLSGPLAAGAYVCVSVSDTGPGIPEAALKRVFEPLFSPKGRAGTGLGLPTLRAIAADAGGAVDIASLPGGTRVKVYLPATTEPLPAAKVPFKPAAVREGSETLLLVEDEEMVRSVLRRHLVSRGYEVLEAATPEEAERVVTGHHGRIDLLLCDVVLPGINGWELGERLQRRRPGMRLLFLSGYAHDTVALQAVLGKGAHFLAKPVSGEELSRKVREALA